MIFFSPLLFLIEGRSTRGVVPVFFSGVQPRVMWIGIGGFVFLGAYDFREDASLGYVVDLINSLCRDVTRCEMIRPFFFYLHCCTLRSHKVYNYRIFFR